MAWPIAVPHRVARANSARRIWGDTGQPSRSTIDPRSGRVATDRSPGSVDGASPGNAVIQGEAARVGRRSLPPHHGVISRGQADDLGLTDRQIDRRIANRSWVRVHNGVYRLAAVAGDVGVPPARCGAGQRAEWPRIGARPPSGGSTRSWRRAIEVTVPHGPPAAHPWRDRPPVPTVGAARRDRETGYPVHRGSSGRSSTTPPSSPLRTLEREAESAIRRGSTSWPRLLRCLCQHSIQGRNGCGRMRELLPSRVANGRITLSDFGLLVAQLLEEHGVAVPVREYPILDDQGNHILQADLAWPDRKKAWELDGLAFHFGRAEVENGSPQAQPGQELRLEHPGDPVVDVRRRTRRAGRDGPPLPSQLNLGSIRPPWR